MTDSEGNSGTPEEPTKAEFKARGEALRLALVNTQYRLREADFSVVVVLAGPDRIGCEQVVDRLHEWMDGRLLDTWFAGPRTDEEASRPHYWRFWRNMPARGRSLLVVGATFTELIGQRLRGERDPEQSQQDIQHFNMLERLLTDGGIVFLKLWLDIPAKAMKQRLKELDADNAPYVEKIGYEILKKHKQAKPIINELLDVTSEQVPWTIIDGRDERARDLGVAEQILSAMQSRLEAAPPDRERPGKKIEIRDHLAQVDLTKALKDDDYDKQLDKLQGRLHELSLDMRNKQLGVVLAFEGWDAGGKGGAIRRITRAISARDCKVIPVAAPTDEESAHHYLWRFWRYLPRDGQMRIFDRSWYGRVLVERVENFATEHEWGRAYEEINDFESMIFEHGHVIQKFWLHIDPEEQIRRFKAREVTPYKKHKITEEDYRNREKWPAYEEAINEMVERTSTKHAPWHLIPANDKRWARVEILGILCNAIEDGLKRLKRKR